MNEKIRFLRDDDCHWYAVPEPYVRRFHALLEVDEDKFIDEFDHLRCDHPSNYIVYIVNEV